ncbi:MAG: PepSY domain-containing protein [Clostridia bacterium]|nr:PepSY domain-containing protein [Clostridia bacterium]
MTNHDVESKIKQAFENATPDLLDAILQKSQQQKGKVIYMEQKKNKTAPIRRITAIAAALVLCIGGFAGYSAYANLAVDSIIELDVNPSIQLEVNSKERVIAVSPLNEDAKIVVGDMDFKGSDVDVAVNALIGSMLRNGYINDMANSILLSVNNDDPAKGAELQSRLSEEINTLLQTETFEGAVLSQNITADQELDALAQQHGITAGKAKLVQQITAQNAMHTFEELAPLSINELNLLSSSAGLENVNSVGSASDKAYIGEAEAKAAAVAHAGVKEAEITRYEVEMDYERGTMVYEIEFHHNGREYDYDIDAVTGEVLWSESERDDDYRSAKQPQNSQNQQPQDQQNSQQQSKPAPAEDGYIGKEAAKAAALAHAGLSEAQVSRMKCELDREDGRVVYEIEFKCDGMEYEYEIDASSGSVLKYDKERDD